MAFLFRLLPKCALAVMAAWALFALVAGGAAAANDDASPANRLFVRVIQLVEKADASIDLEEEGKLLRDADKLLTEIVTKYPDSGVAVQIVTSQFVGDFDVVEFHNRIKNLVCNDPTSTACFLRRVEKLLPAIETPIATARWDWLSLAVAYNLNGDPARAKEIIAPFVAAVKRGAGAESQTQDLFVARALSLMGQIPAALEITRGIEDCSTRVYNLTDLSQAALWADDRAQATSLAEEAQQYANANSCKWEQALVTLALHRVGKDAEAKAAFRSTVEEQFAKGKGNSADCCAPELALAASQIGDPNLALNILRVVEDDNPWIVPGVLGQIARRGETNLAMAYAEQLSDVDARGESFTDLLAAALARKDRHGAEDLYKRVSALVDEAQGRRPGLLAQKARALKLLYGDERWRQSFLAALNAAERASNFIRRDIGAPLLAVLVEITTGQPMLD